MIQNQYRITLYNTQFFSKLLTYHFPVMPLVGDMIEVLEERTMFIVQSRSFRPNQEQGLISVTLHGVFEGGEEMGQHTYEKIREKVQDEYQGLKRCWEGFVMPPDNLEGGG